MKSQIENRIMYRLADEDDMRAMVLKEWKKRCQAD